MVVDIDYDDGNGETYRSVRLHFDDGSVLLFNSGNFIKDWSDFMKFVITEQPGPFYSVAFSSSVHHFISDCGLYEYRYLTQLDKENDVWDLIENESEDGFIFFVPNGDRSNWKEFRKKYGDLRESNYGVEYES